MKRPSALTKTAVGQSESSPISPSPEPLARFGVLGGKLSFVTAIALLSFFLFSSLWIGSRRLFWYDEISTVLVARLPDFATIWRAFDVIPPAYFILIRLFDRALGGTELAARIPSALALTASRFV